MRVAFSYYGGKGMHVSKYPEPKYDTIIEPFAGAACYSCKYHYKKVILCDNLNEVINIWKFLQSKEALKIVNDIPDKVLTGQKIDNLFNFKLYPEGFEWLIRSATNVGQFGTGINKLKKCKSITKLAAFHWKLNTKDKINYWNNKIQHWEFINKDYKSLKNIKGTWFIDPPYNNISGSGYFKSNINYKELAEWCLSRNGEVIVCENEGSNWLPFEYLDYQKGVNGKKHYKKRNSEAIFYKNNED